MISALLAISGLLLSCSFVIFLCLPFVNSFPSRVFCWSQVGGALAILFIYLFFGFLLTQLE